MSAEAPAPAARAQPAGPPDRRSSRVLLLVAAFGVFFPPFGLIALVMATRALRRETEPHNRRVPLIAATLGATSGITSVGLIAWGLTALEPSPVSVQDARGAAPRWVQHGPARALGPTTRATAPGARSGRRTDDEVIRIGPEVRSLRDELAYQHAVALEQDKRLLLLVDVSDCAPCDAVRDALGSPRLARVIAEVRIVTASADHFAIELSSSGIPIDAFPGFAIVGSGGEPMDYVNGGEWDDDVPKNIAPVLESFVLGTYHTRRMRWRGIHDDETLL